MLHIVEDGKRNSNSNDDFIVLVRGGNPHQAHKTIIGCPSTRFPIFEEGAALTRREEAVDAVGPPTDFVDIDLLPLREPEVITAHIGQTIDPHVTVYILQGRYIADLYDVAHVSGWAGE